MLFHGIRLWGETFEGRKQNTRDKKETKHKTKKISFCVLRFVVWQIRMHVSAGWSDHSNWPLFLSFSDDLDNILNREGIEMGIEEIKDRMSLGRNKKSSQQKGEAVGKQNERKTLHGGPGRLLRDPNERKSHNRSIRQ